MARIRRWSCVGTVVFVFGLVPLAGCGEDVKPVPDEAYGRVSDGLPAGATLITKDELDRRVAAGEIVRVSLKTAHDLEAAATAREDADDATIMAALAAHPAIGRLVPDPPADDDATVTPIGDGNYRHTVHGAGGRSFVVTTFGPRWWKAEAARAIRIFPTRDNQRATYGALWNGLSAEQRSRLALVDPALIDQHPSAYPVDDIRRMVDTIVGHADWLGQITTDATKPAGYVDDCTKEMGYGGGSDASHSSYTDPACAFQSGGIYKNYSWNMKWWNTCVKDQANRGTCSIFGDTSAIEYWVARKFNVWANLSEQAFYNRAKFVWEPMDYGDGFMAEKAFQSMLGDGWLLPFENQWTYNPADARLDLVGECRKKCAAGDGNCWNACKSNPENRRYSHSCDGYSDTCSDSTHQSQLGCADVLGFYWCGYWVPEKNPNYQGYRIEASAHLWDAADKDASLARIKWALDLKIPVVIGHSITTAWDAAAASDGYIRYKANDTNRGGHGIHVVGYIENNVLAELIPTAPQGAGGGYLIIKNSWSNCAGDGGYLYAPYQSVKDNTPDATLLYGIK